MSNATTSLDSPYRDVAGRASDERQHTGAGRWVVLGLILLALAVVLFPFLLALLNAFKLPPDYAAHGPLSFPEHVSFDATIKFWVGTDFTRKLFNSAFISGGAAIGAVTLSLLNAFAFGVGRVKGRRLLLAILLLAIMVPQEALVYPIYYLTKSIGMYDTMTSVMIVFIVLHSAFGTYLLSAVLTAYPREILEAAEIDGASKWQVLWLIVVPTVRPTLAVLGVFFFIWTWNEFLLPLIMLPSNNNQTVSVAFGALNGEFVVNETTTAAAALLGILPTVIFFLIFQRTLTRGIVVGAIK